MKYAMRQKALSELRDLADSPRSLLVIHYSCESLFNRPQDATPRITSLAIRNYGSGQTTSFSIHKIAEIDHIPYADIASSYDKLEKQMLDEYFAYIRSHKDVHWLHWNMRDISFGFQAIEHRYRVLGGNPEVIQDENKHNLAGLLIDIYGVHYAKHPRLTTLIELNDISKEDYLPGPEEAKAFENKEYIKLHQSTLRKVDIFPNILGRVLDGKLKTQASFLELYGLTPKDIGYWLKDHWLATLLMTIFAVATSIWGLLK